MATGRLFEVNLPLPPGCWTPEDGRPLIAAFLCASDPGIFGRLKLPWMLCKPLKISGKKAFTSSTLYDINEQKFSIIYSPEWWKPGIDPDWPEKDAVNGLPVESGRFDAELLRFDCQWKKNWVLLKRTIIKSVKPYWVKQDPICSSMRLYQRVQDEIFICCPQKIATKQTSQWLTKSQRNDTTVLIYLLIFSNAKILLWPFYQVWSIEHEIIGETFWCTFVNNSFHVTLIYVIPL